MKKPEKKAEGRNVAHQNGRRGTMENSHLYRGRSLLHSEFLSRRSKDERGKITNSSLHLMKKVPKEGRRRKGKTFLLKE